MYTTTFYDDDVDERVNDLEALIGGSQAAMV